MHVAGEEADHATYVEGEKRKKQGGFAWRIWGHKERCGRGKKAWGPVGNVGTWVEKSTYRGSATMKGEGELHGFLKKETERRRQMCNSAPANSEGISKEKEGKIPLSLPETSPGHEGVGCNRKKTRGADALVLIKRGTETGSLREGQTVGRGWRQVDLRAMV